MEINIRNECHVLYIILHTVDLWLNVLRNLKVLYNLLNHWYPFVCMENLNKNCQSMYHSHIHKRYQYWNKRKFLLKVNSHFYIVTYAHGIIHSYTFLTIKSDLSTFTARECIAIFSSWKDQLLECLNDDDCWMACRWRLDRWNGVQSSVRKLRRRRERVARGLQEAPSRKFLRFRSTPLPWYICFERSSDTPQIVRLVQLLTMQMWFCNQSLAL